MSKNQTFLFIEASIGGVLAGLSLSQLGVWWMPIGLALLWSISRTPYAAFLWGTIAVLFSHRWLLALHPLDWIGVPSKLSLPIAIFIWVLCGCFGGLLVMTWAWLGNKLVLYLKKDNGIKVNLLWAILMSAIWALTETQLARLPLFWIGIGESVLPEETFLAGIARWFGSGGLAVINLMIGWWINKLFYIFKSGFEWKRVFVAGTSLLIFFNSLGWLLSFPEDDNQSLSVALWQPSIPTRLKFNEVQRKALPEKLNSSIENAYRLGADIFAAPEGSLLINQELLSPSPLTVLIGGFRWEKGRQRSSLLVFEKGETKFSRYLDKHRLVPIGEWVPQLLQMSSKGLSYVGGLEAGEPSRSLHWSGPQIAGAICYEISNGIALRQSIKDGSKWILAIANLDPYPKLLQKQFLALAQIRSIETSRNVVMVSNTGPTGIVLSNGRVSKTLKSNKQSMDLMKLSLNKEITLYTLWGELPLKLLILCCLLFLIVESKRNFLGNLKSFN